MTTKKKNKGGAGNLGKRFRKIEVPYKGEIKFFTQGLFRYDGKELPLIRGKRAERKTLCKLSDLAKFPIGRARTEELERLWTEKLAELQKSGKGLEVTTESRTFADLSERFRGSRLPTIKDESFAPRLEFWETAVGSKPIKWLKDGLSEWPAEIIKHKDKLGKRLNRYGEPISPTTVNRYLEVVSIVFSYAQTLGWTDLNPMKRPGMKHEINNEVVRYLGQFDQGEDEGELDRIINACRESESPDLWDAFRFSIGTGCRQGEFKKLLWTHVNLKTGVIQFVDRKNKEDIEVDLSLNSDLMQMLRNRKMKSATARVFPTNPCKCAWNTARRKAGIGPDKGKARFRWHDLRHHFATTLRGLGVELDDIKHSTGHKDLKSLLRYAHIKPGLARENIGKVAQALKIS